MKNKKRKPKELCFASVQKFFIELSRKFYHRGDFGRSVGLQKFTEEERSALSFWDTNGMEKRKNIIPRFIQSYATSRFSVIPFLILVEEMKTLVYKEDLFTEEQRLYHYLKIG
ncbi:hypothetical protein [Enterococcus sp.]|uniref:hypothetical protein n=1 Tax=Enterococcus sp. TaxID=35783 RepID=UPI0039969244